MAPTLEFTDPSTHPRFIREQREITALLVQILIARGRSERQAIREAEAILAPMPQDRASKRLQVARQAR
jgi:hypothetical protein